MSHWINISVTGVTFMKMTVLLENTTSDPRFTARHGLSIYIETDCHKVLFDAGPDDSFQKNAAALGIELGEVDIFVLSHGHNDHGGGLRSLMESNSKARIFIRKSAFEPHFSCSGANKTMIGLDEQLAESSRIIWTSDVHRIDDELLLFSDITGSELLQSQSGCLKKENDGLFVPDDFSHEQNLIITQNGCSALFTGCAHRGLYNILQSAKRHCDNLAACAGGFHLKNPSTGVTQNSSLIRSLADELAKTGIQLYTGHCTGEEAFVILFDILGDQVRYMRTGETFDID